MKTCEHCCAEYELSVNGVAYLVTDKPHPGEVVCRCMTWESRARRAEGLLVSAERTALEESESAHEAHGILADVCDALWGDEERALQHGYEGVVEKAAELRAEVERLEYDLKYFKRWKREADARAEIAEAAFRVEERDHAETRGQLEDAQRAAAFQTSSIERLNEQLAIEVTNRELWAAEAQRYKGVATAAEAKCERLWEVETAARALIDYETTGAPDYTEWEERFETLRAFFAKGDSRD